MLTLQNENFIHNYINESMEKKISNLRKDYEENQYIDAAIIDKVDNDNINITLILNVPIDTGQDAVMLFEKGGIIIDEEKVIEIEPGFYIERNIIND